MLAANFQTDMCIRKIRARTLVLAVLSCYKQAGSEFLCMRTASQGRQMKAYGSIRRTDCVECEIVLVSGVYLIFRLPTNKVSLQGLVEVKRYRLHMQPRQSILVDAHLLGKARRAALEAILRHRVAMHLLPRVDKPKERRPFQPRLL